MKLTTDYYGFGSISTEGLFLRLARQILIIQDDAVLNPDSLTIVTVDTDETEKLSSVSISDVSGNFGPNMELKIINPFKDTLTTTGTLAPWNKTNHLAALVDLGIWLCNQERSLQANPDSRFVLDYSITSRVDVIEPHLDFSLNASDIPLNITLAGQAGASEALSWLVGEVA